MWQRLGIGGSVLRPDVVDPRTGSRGRRNRRPVTEVLEDRQLLTASLQSIADLSVPAQLGAQVVLDGSGNTNPSQTYTVTSDNPDIPVSVAQGPYWTLTVSHQAANASDVAIDNQSFTFQLFQDLAPNTVNRIVNLNNLSSGNFYTTQGKYLPRIIKGFMAQGGSTSATSTASSSGYQPISTEPVQQLAFTGQAQLAMANTGQPNSTDAQFFITNAVQPTATQQALDFGYTIIGQLVAGQQTLVNLSNVAVQKSSTNELSLPINPVTITAATLSSTNVNGVVHVDTTSARAGETAHITVTATDPQDGSQVTRTFAVTVSAYNGPTQPLINFKPFATDATATTDQDVATTITVTGQSGFPDTNYPGALSYAIVTQPAHGTISQFDASTGRLVYTPAAGYHGPDSFQYQVTGAGPWSGLPNTVSNPATVSITINAALPAPPPPPPPPPPPSSRGDPERRQQEPQSTASVGADRTELQRRGERRSGPADRDVSPGATGDSRVVHRQERQGAGSEIGPVRPDHPDRRPDPQEPAGPQQDRAAPDRQPVGRERPADRRRPERLGRGNRGRSAVAIGHRLRLILDVRRHLYPPVYAFTGRG